MFKKAATMASEADTARANKDALVMLKLKQLSVIERMKAKHESELSELQEVAPEDSHIYMYHNACMG